MLTINDKFYDRTIQAIFLTVLVTVVLTFRHYGITWDEELQSQYGQAVVDYYFSGFKDPHYAEIFNLYLYGGMFDGFASLIDRFTPFRLYETRHLVNALFGVLGLWGTLKLGRFVGGQAVGLMALILLTLTPVYYGHMFNNPKDIPFAAGVIWAIYFMGRCFSEWPQPKKSLLIKLSLILGLTLGVRVGGVMVLAFWIAALGLDAMRPLCARIDGAALRQTFLTAWRYGLRMVLPVALGAYAVMLICWPWAQQNPIMNPLRALSEFSNFPQDVEVLLDGTIYRSTQLPWTYVPVYFGIQMPELILFLLACFTVSLPWIWRSLAQPQRHALSIILMMGLIPITYAMLRHPALYDAVRHFLFAVPLACVVAALAARHLYLWANSKFDRERSKLLVSTGMMTVFILSAVTQLGVMIRLHPYEYIYANSFAGGVSGAYGRYELDYWGSSFKEAAQKIQDYVNAEGGVPPGRIYKVAICGPWAAAMIYLPPDYEPVVANEPAEFFLSTTRWMCQDMRPGKEIIKIKRVGAPLAVVKDLRDADGNPTADPNSAPKKSKAKTK